MYARRALRRGGKWFSRAGGLDRALSEFLFEAFPMEPLTIASGNTRRYFRVPSAMLGRYLERAGPGRTLDYLEVARSLGVLSVSIRLLILDNTSQPVNQSVMVECAFAVVFVFC